MLRGFENLDFKLQPGGGRGARVMFSNGYGCSVRCTPTSYGGRDGLYEIAVLGPDGDLCYTTPVTDDVIGYLTPEQVTGVMHEIQFLRHGVDAF